MNSYQAPSGPHWTKNARPGFTCTTDARGVIWTVVQVKAGGRHLAWISGEHPSRTATTIATESHPDYPTDAEVLEWSKGDPCQIGTCNHACGCISST